MPSRDLLGEMVRFGLVGVLNTAVGYGTIVLLTVLAGLPPVAANMGGYAVGLVVSFTLNRRYTFRKRSGGQGSALAFLAVFAVAYGVNLIVLSLSLGIIPELWAQACAMASYTVLFFILSRTIVFRPRASDPVEDARP